MTNNICSILVILAFASKVSLSVDRAVIQFEVVVAHDTSMLSARSFILLIEVQ